MTDTTTTTRTGTIFKLVAERGFGFIRPDYDSADNSRSGVFFHRSGVANDAYDQLKEEDRVTYTEVNSPKGPRAESVTPAS